MSALSIVQSLHNLAQDPDHREHIVKDQGCLAVLVMLCGGSNDSEEEMVSLCLETLELLSQNENNKQSMLKEPGLVSTLKKFQQKDSFKSIVDKILINIEGTTNCDHKEINETTKIDSKNIVGGEDNAATTAATTTSPTAYSIPKKSTTFSMLVGEKLPIKDAPVKATPAAAAKSSIDPSLIKTFLLHVKGMNNESTKKQLEECLLKTKGVISFMINLAECQATVRTALSSDEIKLVIRNNVGLSASLIIDGQEEVESTPDYLPEPNNPYNNSNAGGKRWGWGSIISFGQQEQKQKEGNWGWNSFSKVLFG